MLGSLQKLRENPQFWTQVAVGGVLLWLSMYVSSYLTPLILLPMGYAFGLMKGTVHGDDSLPAWGDVGVHIVHGFCTFILFLLCLLPAALVQVLAAASGTNTAVNGVITKLLGFGFFIMACMGFAFFMIATARYAASGQFSSAFAVKEIASQLGRSLGDFVVLAALCGLASTFMTVFANVLNTIIPFGLIWLVVGAASFTLLMVCSHTTGVLYRDHFIKPAPAAIEAPSSPEE